MRLQGRRPRMRTIKTILAGSIVMLLVCCGCMLLMMDFPTPRQTWMGVVGSLACFIIAMWLARYFETKKYLPE